MDCSSEGTTSPGRLPDDDEGMRYFEPPRMRKLVVIKCKALLAAVSTAGLLVTPNLAAAAASNCRMAQLADWKVQQVNDALIVDGSINGQKVGVMIDTGAGSTLILRSAAQQLGLKRQPLQGYQAFGIGDEADVELGYVEEFRIGQSSRTNLQMVVAGENDLGGTVGVILGEDFFQSVDLEFDLAHNAIRMYQPLDCDGVSLAYWTTAADAASEVAIDPVDKARPQIVLSVQVNGRRVKALLDSGSKVSVLDKYEASMAGVTPETPGVVRATGAMVPGQKALDTWIGPFQSFTIGDEMIKNTNIYFCDMFRDATFRPAGSRLSRKVDELQPMLLGDDFLRAHRVLVSHSQRKIYFTYAGGPVFQADKAAEAKRTPSAPPADTKP
jgi:predicted aspartyl protease